MAAKRHYRFDAAFNAEWRLLYVRTAYRHTFSRSQSGLFPLVVVTPRFHSDPVSRVGHGFGGEIDRKLHRLPYERVAVTLGTHRYIAHSGIGANCSCPCHGQHVGVLDAASAGHYHSWQRIYHRAGLPVLFLGHIQIMSALAPVVA